MSQSERRTLASRRDHAGFTLVELLIVIGIIAILIAVLMPALSKARMSAQKTVCLSNMRQCAIELRMYAMANNDKVPIGYLWSQKWNTAVVWDQHKWNPPAGPSGWSAGWYTHMGFLYPGGFMKNTKIWYCNTEKRPERGFNYRTSNWSDPWNQWPPGGAHNPFSSGTTNKNTSVGYGCRPQKYWTTYGQTTGWNYATNLIPRQIPKLRQLKVKAILAEDVSTSGLRARHVNGMNVAYADGSGRFVPLGAFENNLRTAEAYRAVNNTTQANYFYLNDPKSTDNHNTSTLPNQGVWVDFDMY